jgi:hypothetical protein
MREYDSQRLENMRRLNERIAGVYAKVPAIKQIDEQISGLAESFAASLTKDGSFNLPEYRRKLADLRMEKEALLKCHHIDPAELQMQYRCPDCKDTGYVENEKCHCFKQRIIDEMYQQSNLREILKAENFSTLSYEYYDKENIDKMQIAIERCKSFAETFDKTFENVLLCGTVGIGKTFLSNCIAKEVLDKATKDAADWKKKYNSMLDDDQKKAQEQQAIVDELNALKKANKISEIKSGLIALGYDEQLAGDTAEAQYNNDFAKVMANQKSFLEARDKQNESNALHNMQQPPAGNSGQGVDYVKQMQDAFKANDIFAMGAAIEAQFAANNPAK